MEKLNEENYRENPKDYMITLAVHEYTCPICQNTREIPDIVYLAGMSPVDMCPVCWEREQEGERL